MERPSKKSKLKQTKKPIMIAAVIVIAGLGFGGGMQFQKSRTSSTKPSAQQTPANPFAERNATGGLGKVTAISGESITVEQIGTRRPTQDGTAESGSRTYKITGVTKITKSGKAATATDIKIGMTVMIQSSGNNTDATQIRISGATSSATPAAPTN